MSGSQAQRRDVRGRIEAACLSRAYQSRCNASDRIMVSNMRRRLTTIETSLRNLNLRRIIPLCPLPGERVGPQSVASCFSCLSMVSLSPLPNPPRQVAWRPTVESKAKNHYRSDDLGAYRNPSLLRRSELENQIQLGIQWPIWSATERAYALGVDVFPNLEDHRGVDIGQIRQLLRMTPAERVRYMVTVANKMEDFRRRARIVPRSEAMWTSTP